MSISIEVDGWWGESHLGEGGQGKTYIARDGEGRLGCLKILSNKGMKERRQRFSREAACYASLDLDGVPRLLSSNVINDFSDRDGPLYICTNLIEGKTLDRVRTVDLTRDRIVSAVSRLMGTMHDLHQSGIVHRDIKPQNLIARASNTDDIVIVDFGLAHSSVALDDFQTELGQELGNRFLRLPELQAGSRVKQDPVTDVTFGVGILFYLITGIAPRSLADGQGRMPHQREDVASSRLLGDSEFKYFLPIFDKGFQLRVDDRFQSVTDFTEALRRERVSRVSQYKTLEQIIDQINQPTARAKQQRFKHRDLFINTAHVLARKIEERLNGVYVFSQTGHNVNEKSAETQVGFALGQDYRISELVPFKAEIIGAQIVATAWGEEILRCDADTPDWGATLTPAIENALTRALNTLQRKAPGVRPD